jgi:LPS-assembly protein
MCTPPLLFFPNSAQADQHSDEVSQLIDQKTADAALSVTADQLIRQGSSGVVEANGDVVIKYGNKTATGDNALLNPMTGEGTIIGNAQYTENETSIWANKILINSKTHLGTLYSAKGNVGSEYYFSGDKIERIAENHYLIVKGTCTSCPPENNSWRLDAKEVDLTMEGYAFMKSMVFRAGNVPILWLPYMIVPAKTKRATGLLEPSIGTSTESGFAYGQSFFWAISDNMDATLTYHYFGENSSRYGLQYRYILDHNVNGSLDGDFLQQREDGRDFWKILWRHHHKLPYNIIGKVLVDRESENNISREYDDSVSERTRRYSESYVDLQKNWSTTRTAQLQVKVHESTVVEDEEMLNTVPALLFNNYPEKLGETPFYGALESSYYNYHTKKVSAGITDEWKVDRVDVYPKLSLPVAIAPWLNVTPSLEYRLTWYSNGVEDGVETKEGFLREYYKANVSLVGPSFYSIFERPSKWRPRIKHLIIPRVKWSYIPGYDYKGENRLKVRVVDGIDDSSPYNLITYSITNTIFAKQINNNKSSTVQLVNFSVSQGYNLIEATRTENPDDEKKPFTSILFDLDTKLMPWLLANFDLTYNTYDQHWEKYNAEIGFRYNDQLHFAVDHNVEYPYVAWDTAYFEIALPWKIRADYSIVYFETENQIHASVLRLQKMFECWGVKLAYHDRLINQVNSSGVTEPVNEKKYMLTITLKGIGDAISSGNFTGSNNPVAQRKL